MQVAAYDPTNLDKMIAVLDSMRAHREQSPLNKSDELYYGIVADYYKAIRDADRNGKPRVYHNAQVPTEIFFAMDIVPVEYEPVAIALTNLSNSYEDALSIGKAYGLAPETCSIHRLMTGVAVNGWLPKPDAIVWSYLPGCDVEAKSNDNLRRLWSAPGFFIDRGYYDNPRELSYFVEELRETIEFLEGITGRKMDYDRLSDCVARTRELMQVERELDELKKATPAPLRSRSGMLAHMVSVYAQGTQQAVDFYKVLRDEAKERVERGDGFVKDQKYRLLLFFEPPAYGWKILDWLDRAHNAVLVYEPVFASWGPGDLDPAKPLESLALKTFIKPGWSQTGPVESLVDDMVRGAKEYKADGVFTFCHVGCRQSSACNRIIKDRIAEETGLPFFTVETDIADPSFVSEQEMRDKIEGFLEMIDERRG